MSRVKLAMVMMFLIVLAALTFGTSFGQNMRNSLFSTAPSDDYARATALISAAQSTSIGPEKQRLTQEAITIFSTVIQKNNQHYDAYIQRGAAYYDLGQYAAAIADNTAALTINPDLVDALQNRGMAFEHQGEVQRALNDYARALTILEKQRAIETRAQRYQDLQQRIRSLQAQTP